jgi:hypothetical protein
MPLVTTTCRRNALLLLLLFTILLWLLLSEVLWLLLLLSLLLLHACCSDASCGDFDGEAGREAALDGEYCDAGVNGDELSIAPVANTYNPIHQALCCAVLCCATVPWWCGVLC